MKDATFSLIDQLPHHTPLNFQLILTQTCIISCQTVLFWSARAGPGLWDPWEDFKKDATFSLIDQLPHHTPLNFQLILTQTCIISCQTVLFWSAHIGPALWDPLCMF